MNAFQSILLPRAVAPFRAEIIAELASHGVGAGTYFSPHLAEQPYFERHGVAAALPVTRDIASRVVSLPLLPEMSLADVSRVASALRLATGPYQRLLGDDATFPATKHVSLPAAHRDVLVHNLAVRPRNMKQSERRSA